MKIAIHQTKGSFSDRWIEYCEQKHIAWKSVNCFHNNIVQQISDCNALMWHFSQNNPKAILIAKQLIYSIEASGKKVFPDFNTVWHFDDKAGQKYLFESVDAPLVPSWIFYDKHEALSWTQNTSFPKVFKLRGGAGSQNVRLVHSKNEAIYLINKAFSRGFPAYDPLGSLKERYRLYRLGKTNFCDLLEGIIRFVIPPPYSRKKGKEKGYIYFQEFIAGNNHDTRVIVIGDKAFAIQRMVREKDFRASGSGKILYDRRLFDESTIRLSFDLAARLKSQCVAFDFVNDKGKPLLVEISYGFTPAGYDPCKGFWDKDLNWHEGKFNPYGWMVEDLIKEITLKGQTVKM
jgi:glutathione synthase/RimK-type ligase-like ATP-grasp enzyme